MEETKCLACNHTESRKKFAAIDIKVTQGTYVIVECLKCGFIYLNPRPAYIEIELFYGSKYYAYKDFKANINLSKVRSNGLRYLDIGAGSGFDMIDQIKKGYDTYGLEIDETAVNLGVKKGLKISRYDGRKTPFDDNFFDVISLNHVIEHAHFLIELLQEIYRILKRNGKLHISCPNINSYESEIYGNIWRHLDVPRHLYFFSPTILEKVLMENNFKINVLTTYNTPIFDRNLTYIKSCYTMFMTKNFMSSRKNLLCKSINLIFILKNFIKYSMHNSIGLKGQMIRCTASK